MRKLVFMLLLFAVPVSFYAQGRLAGEKGSVVGIKTNLPYWGTATFNLGAEFRLARHWSLDLEAGLNPFDGKNDDGSYGKSLRHLRVHPELRYWFCETSHSHFVGLHIPYLLYNVSDIGMFGLEGLRRQGWGAGAGISYGYSWLLSKHWNLEATLGAGYLYLESEKYPCADCGRSRGYEKKHYFGPTQAAVNLIYQF